MEAHVDRKQAGRLRAERATEAGAGAARLQGFTAQFRAQPVQRDGKSLIQLDGYASTTDKPYDMWDLFGPYQEQVASGAFDATLAAKPDVAYLVNHKGVTMARTTNGTLELEADFLGLRTRAYVNPARQDVRDLLTAIEDRNITEMSFAFMIDDVEWNEDFTQCTIKQVNLDRGDVSAVNYGANPFTSVAARSSEILRDLAKLPAGAQRAAYERLDKSLRAAPIGADEASLMQAVDAAIDEACAAFQSIDPASLPPDVGQAIALVYAADAACDAMMDATGTYDADDDDDTGSGDGYMGRAAKGQEVRAAIPVHHTATVDTAWDGPAAEKAANGAAELKHMHAWVDSSGDPDVKENYKLPHHAPGTDTAANLHGVRDALSRLPGTDIPESDKAAVKAHLEAHLKDGGGGQNAHHHEYELSQVERLTRDLDAAPRGSDIRLIEQLLELS
jgi:HK97 family phage prohead protease